MVYENIPEKGLKNQKFYVIIYLTVKIVKLHFNERKPKH
jgi:hypothetical protein